MGSKEVNEFLTHLAVEGHVSASTQIQALSALLFLYRELLERDLELEGVVRARPRKRLPVVLSEAEVRAVREEPEGGPALVVGLLYGGGLRLMEALRLRVQDLDIERREVTVRDGKGGKDRRTLLPGSQCTALLLDLQKVHRLHQQDQEAGWGAVMLPNALARKYRHTGPKHREGGPTPHRSEPDPKGRETCRQTSQDHKTGKLSHLPEFLRLPPARAGGATMIYIHVLKRWPMGVISPADDM